MYNLLSDNCHPFHENMAPDLLSPPLNALPHRSDFQIKRGTTTSCVHVTLDTQGEISYGPNWKRKS
jgi:hypothetical protein